MPDGIDLNWNPQAGAGGIDLNAGMSEGPSSDGISLSWNPETNSDINVPMFQGTDELPTIESVSELPGDLLARTGKHASQGVESFLTGAASLVPFTEETIWRKKGDQEGWANYLLNYLKPLGLVGGPIETVLSPATALVSEGLRLSGEADKTYGMSERLGMDIPLAHRLEKFAPVVSGLLAAPFTPAWLGGLRRASAASTTQKASRAAERAAQGWQSTEGTLKGLTDLSPAAGELGSRLRTAASERGRFEALMGGEARFGEAGEVVDTGLRQKLIQLEKTDPVGYAEVIQAADPQRFIDRLPGYEIFSRSKTAKGWKRGMSRTATDYVNVPEELADDVEKFTTKMRAGKTKGRVDLTEENLLTAFNKRFGGEDVDPDVADAVLEKLARTTTQLREGANQVPWFKPESAGAAAVQPALRELFHATRGLGVRAQRQYGARALNKEGKNIKFTKVPTGTYFPHTFTPEVSQAIREEKEAARILAGKPVTSQPDIVTGEQFSSITRGGHVRSADIQRYIMDPVQALEQNAQNWARQMGRTRAFGPKGDLFTENVQRIAKELGPKVAKDIDFAARRDLNYLPPRTRAADILTTFESMTKMSLSFISNVTQPAMNVVVNGLRDTTKGMWDTIHQAIANKSMNGLTKELGLARKAAQEALRQEMGGAISNTRFGKVASAVLKPFEIAEGPMNRNVAAATGRRTMLRFESKLKKVTHEADATDEERLATVRNALSKSEWRSLAKNDLNIADIQTRIARNGGGFTKDEIRRGTWGFVDRTQFLQRPTAVPNLARNSSLARVMFQMKSFSMRASGMIVEEVFKEARKGNFAPLARLSVTYPIVGEASRQAGSAVRHPITGTEPFPTDVKGAIQRALEDSIYVGGLGIFSDAISAAARGREAWTGFIAGPGLSELGSEAKSLWDMGQHYVGGPEERQKYDAARRKWLMGWAKRVPFGGSALAESMKTQSELQKTIKAQGGH